MKNLIIIFLIASLSSCSVESIFETSPKRELPSESYNGSENFGFVLNKDDVWVAQWHPLHSILGSRAIVLIGGINPSNELRITAERKIRDRETNELYNNEIIIIHGLVINDPMPFVDLEYVTYKDYLGANSYSCTSYNLDSTYNNVINITRNDSILSGTFDFRLISVHDNCLNDTIYLSQGRFNFD